MIETYYLKFPCVLYAICRFKIRDSLATPISLDFE